ncbi:hypothetical protein F5Y13DRAFT_125619 [Hypoxylon sp. FL1857]|nr:hypothetical protein F5Y13DRAFT_125619 [Hypoxylon sp. FL1857]
MNEGTYNNVIRSNSPFSPMTPSTPNTYKTNVNRTKTRKWVEAKVQNYDGDDWGNEYEDEYDEPEPEPAPPAQPTSRIAALRQQSRTFPQPAGAADSNAQGPLGTRGPNGPPSLHIQTGVSPRLRPVEATSSAPGQSRFPPRESSVTRQEISGPRDMGASMSGSRPGSGSNTHPLPTQRGATPTGPGRPSHFARPADIYNRVEVEREKERRSVESNRPSIEGGSSRTDGARSSTEQRRRTSFENHDGSDASRGQKPTLAAVDEQKGEYGSSNLGGLGDGNEANQGRANPPRLSSGPKLPDLARMSGFGDDFFSTSGGYGSLARPSLSPVSDNQPTDAAAKIGPSAELEDRRRNTAGLSDEKHPPSALEGPKLEPNPRIIMPPLDDNLEPKKTDIAGTSGQPAPPRPQLPGTWVSETVSAGSASPAPTEKTEGLGQASLGSTANTDVSPMSKRHAEPADLEPTTTVRQLPSTQDDSKAEQENKATHKSGEGSFDSPTGKHDDAVASKVIAAGPGHHPTPQSLPPLKTENPLAPPNAAQKDGQETSGPNDMASRTSGYRDSPSHLYSNQQSAATTGSSFTPTAPLNPRRSVVAPADLVTPAIQERKSTMSTVDTASPEKESDKLREEIIKSLSASPATTPDASAILGSANNGFDPTPGELTRESTYLSGVYDDYLALAEEKSLQETGQLLKQGPKLADHGPEQFEVTSGPSVQQGNSFPDIAPLSPRRSPEQETVRRPRRFSWERSSEKAVRGPDEAKSNVLAPPPDLIPSGQSENKSAAALDLGAAGASPGSLHVQADDTGTVSHQVSQVSSRAPGELSSTIPEPSPVSFTTTERSPQPQNAVPDASRLSLADEKEKVLVQSSSNPSSIEGHPALANPIELTPSESPAVQPTPTAQSTQQAKVMAFRDILNIASIELRIQKFDETRDQFYSMESGLSNWIAYMKSQSDHGTGTMSLGGQPVLAQGQSSPSGVQPPTQQPYYQQYLNASNPGAPPAQPGRVTSGNLQHMFTGQPMSSFGSSSNQVGAKSKELLHTAGAFGNKGIKSGMKLFNKGKNKLRGTGDKVFF